MNNYNAAERLERLPFTRWHWGIIAIALIIWLTEAIDNGLTGATIPSLKSAFKLSGAEIGTIASVTTLGIIISLILSGVAIDYFGKRKTLMLGMLIFGLATVITAFAPSFSIVILFRFLAGLGMGMVFTIPYQFVVEFVPAKYRGYAVGSINAVLNFGYFANLLAASIIVPDYGWRPMYIFGGISLIALIFVYFYMPESPRWLEMKGRYAESDRMLNQIEGKIQRYSGKQLPEVSHRIPLVESTKSAPFKEIFRGQFLRRTLILWVTTSCLWSTWYLFSLYLPQMLQMQGYELGGALLTSAVVNATPIATHLFGAWLLDKLGRKLTISLYSIISMIGIIVFALSKSYAWGLIGASVAFSFMGASFSFTKLFAAEQYPTRLRGTGTAWTEAVGRGVAGALIPILLAEVLINNGILAVSELVLVLGVIGIIIFAIGSKETKGLVLEQLDPKISQPESKS